MLEEAKNFEGTIEKSFRETRSFSKYYIVIGDEEGMEFVQNKFLMCHAWLLEPFSEHLEKPIVGIYSPFYKRKDFPEFFEWLLYDSVFAQVFEGDREYHDEYGLLIDTTKNPWRLSVTAAIISRYFYENDLYYENYLNLLKGGFSPEAALLRLIIKDLGGLSHTIFTPHYYPISYTNNFLNRKFNDGEVLPSSLEDQMSFPYFSPREINRIWDVEGEYNHLDSFEMVAKRPKRDSLYTVIDSFPKVDNSEIFKRSAL